MVTLAGLPDRSDVPEGGARSPETSPIRTQTIGETPVSGGSRGVHARRHEDAKCVRGQRLDSLPSPTAAAFHELRLRSCPRSPSQSPRAVEDRPAEAIALDIPNREHRLPAPASLQHSHIRRRTLRSHLALPGNGSGHAMPAIWCSADSQR